MRFRKSIVSAVGVAGVLVTVGYASAEPAAAAAGRCWVSDGVRHCRSLESRYYRYGSRNREYNNPDAYRTGSSDWWREMDRLDRGGRGRR
jgi:hypothetical protein